MENREKTGKGNGKEWRIMKRRKKERGRGIPERREMKRKKKKKNRLKSMVRAL